jgi:hypothetical protein
LPPRGTLTWRNSWPDFWPNGTAKTPAAAYNFVIGRLLFDRYMSFRLTPGPTGRGARETTASNTPSPLARVKRKYILRDCVEQLKEPGRPCGGA